MKKYLLYAVVIVIYSVVVVLLRHSSSSVPNWVFWVFSFALVLILGWIGNIGKNHTEDSQGDQPDDITTKED